MQTLAATAFGKEEPFAATQWSVIVAAGESQVDPETSRAALAQLCEIYWPPLYTFARARGYSRHDAQDLTQAFFVHLLGQKIYKQTDPRKGKFRSFLLASFRHFISDERDREMALKRGGGRTFLPLEEARAEAAESLFQSRDSLGQGAISEDRLYERTWAETLVATTLERLAALYKAEAKGTLFEHLKSFVTVSAEPFPSYSDLATRLGIGESTLRSQVTRLRARHREILRAEVRRTVADEAEVDAELRELVRVLSNA